MYPNLDTAVQNLHFITATREKLFQWNIVESDVCAFCNEHIETLPHLLVECEVINYFGLTSNYDCIREQIY